MGIIFYPAGNKAESFKKPESASASSLLDGSYPLIHGHRSPRPTDLYCSSFSDEPEKGLVRVENGFVSTVVEAYEHHRMLIIRPDDVWLAILVQFNFFVNANAEELRDSFVAHKGKKNLQVQMSIPSRYRIDVGTMAVKFTDLIQEHIVDPSVRDWLMPDFTTTTDLDKSVAAIVMMSTFQEYFSYLGGGCGIPAVTLEGEKGDWQSILRRIEKLKEYGVKTTAWYHLLRPILKRFVKAFDDPNSEENLDFWNRVVHREPLSSGPAYMTGWITAFCLFTRRGVWIGPKLKVMNREAPAKKRRRTEAKKEEDYATLNAEEFAKRYLEQDTEPALVLDGARYERIGSGDIPPGVVGVDITILEDAGGRFNCGMLAGQCAYEISSSGDKTHSKTGKMDRVQPKPGWFLFRKPSRDDQEW